MSRIPFRFALPLLITSALGLAAAPAAQTNVREAPYSAKGDGNTDDTQAFQRALDKAGAEGGGIVFAPAGTYLIATHLRVPRGVTLAGVGRAPLSFDGQLLGTTLLAVEGAGETKGTAFLTLEGPNASIDGVSVFYPNQKIDPAPVPYPWTIHGIGNNVGITNVLLINPYQGVDFATESANRHNIQGLYGQPLYKGLWVDRCYDIGRVKNVHFWPFWSQDPKLIAYMTRNATGFIFQRTDWEVVDDIFVWGYHAGVELSASADGGMNGQMSNVNLDNVDIGIDITATQPYAVHVSNLNIANAGGGDRHIGIWGRPAAKGAAELSVRGASFWGQLHQAVRWENPGTIGLADSRVVEWTLKQPAIEILSGKALIHDNLFGALKQPGVAFQAGAEVGALSFHDNLLNGHQAFTAGKELK